MWWYLLWWLVIVNGNTALGVALINRLHGYRQPEWAIHLGHQIHYLLLVLVPVSTLAGTGWYGPRLLRGGSWTGMAAGWWMLFAVCAAATAVFWGSVVRRHLRRTLPHELQTRSRTLNIAQELGTRPAGAGPHDWMLRLPGNQAFHVEINERELLIPRLPAAWDGLSILHFSDVHFIGTLDRAYFEQVLQHAQSMAADLICFTGDLLDDLDYLSWIPSTFGRLQAPLGCYFILGNHDAWLNLSAIRQQLADIGWQDVSVAAKELVRDGEKLVLTGSEYPWTERHAATRDVPPDVLHILLSHTPDNLPQARRDQVDLMLSGHVHGGQIQLPVIGPVYCPSRYGCYYSAGVFWEAPTLLHVSRGLSGRHPLRLDCLPEITKLILRAPDRKSVV